MAETNSYGLAPTPNSAPNDSTTSFNNLVARGAKLVGQGLLPKEEQEAFTTSFYNNFANEEAKKEILASFNRRISELEFQRDVAASQASAGAPASQAPAAPQAPAASQASAGGAAQPIPDLSPAQLFGVDAVTSAASNSYDVDPNYDISRGRGYGRIGAGSSSNDLAESWRGARNAQLLKAWAGSLEGSTGTERQKSAWSLIKKRLGGSEAVVVNLDWKATFQILSALPQRDLEAVLQAAYVLAGGTDKNGYLAYDKSRAQQAVDSKIVPAGADKVLSNIIYYDRRYGDLSSAVTQHGKSMAGSLASGTAGLFSEEVPEGTTPDNNPKYSASVVASQLYNYGRMFYLLDGSGYRETGMDDWLDKDWSRPIRGMDDGFREEIARLQSECLEAYNIYQNAWSFLARNMGNKKFAAQAIYEYYAKDPSFWEGQAGMEKMRSWLGTYNPAGLAEHERLLEAARGMGSFGLGGIRSMDEGDSGPGSDARIKNILVSDERLKNNALCNAMLGSAFRGAISEQRL